MKARRQHGMDTASFVTMVGRVIRAAGQRVGEGDVEDLPKLLELHELVDVATLAAVGELRRRGWTWRSIGEATGTSHVAAIQKWGRTK